VSLSKLFSCLFVICVLSFSVHAEGWVTDMEAAKASAKKDKKDLLLDFTGSDWCGWCIKLNKEVFDQEAFKTFAGKELVMVELDFPRKKKLDEKLAAQNNDLAQKWGVQGFPTIILADADGMPYAKTGYQAGGPEKYIEHIKTLRAQKDSRDSLLKQAGEAKGIEKAKLLDQMLSKMDQTGVAAAYERNIAEIVELDKDNAAGLKGKYENRKKFEAIVKVAEAEDFDGALKQADEMAKEKSLDPATRQEVHFLRANLLYQKQDKDAAMKALKDAKDASPETARAKEIDALIENLSKQK